MPLTLATIEQHRLWETTLFQPFKPLVDITGGDPIAARNLAYALRCLINIGVLSEVDTITWRSAHAMLSSAQDFRPGCFGHQYHAWQATLDEDAVVFTTNPGNEPRAGTSWVDADLYWNGGPMPRTAQHGAAVINLYAPQYASPGAPLDAFGYLPYTHAYFPTERFDEVRQVGGWTFGRKGDGFVALWSWRPTEWRGHDPAVTFTNGLTQPFDLVAPGGAHNVWVSEVGDAGRWGSFDAFVDAVAAAPGGGGRPGPDPGGRLEGLRRHLRLAQRGTDGVLLDRTAHRRRRRVPAARDRPHREPLQHGRGGKLDGHHPGRQQQPDRRSPDRASAGRDPSLTQSPGIRDGH